MKIEDSVYVGSPDKCEMIDRHQEHRMGYNEFFNYAKKNQLKGIKQEQCKFCGLWIFPDHFGRNWGKE